MKLARQGFGHQLLAEQLTYRIQHHFSGNTNSTDKSLTIGIFGEWGSGKSNLLHLIDETFQQSNSNDTNNTLIVRFNPWRYEREQHLLIPLLKSIQFTARKAVRDEEKPDLKKVLMQIDEFLERAAMAFARAEKNGMGLATERLDTANHSAEISAQNTFDPSNLESMYYEFEQVFQAISQSPTCPIHLLIFIDDLDRCRPEKAVEMLECMKLFLDIEHCAFVVAFDDEVVERGILFRYRDYLLPTTSNNTANSPLPITGIEYLEKIIQLPFRVPQPAKQEIASFLEEQYPELFASSDKDDGVTQRQHLVKNNASKQELLDLFVSLIPAIPRKLIRASELLKLSLEMAKARNCEKQIQPLPLAKIVLLQLFAPDLYRYGRRRYSGFLTTLENWSKKPYWRQADFRSYLEKDYQIKEAESADETIQLEKRNFHRYYHDLIDAFESATKNRTGFDLYQFIQQAQIGMEHLEPYFCFVEGEAYETELQPSVQQEATLPIAKISNQEEILDLLFSNTQGSWQSALQRPEFAGKTLDDALFHVIFERLNTEHFKHFILEIDWLCLLCSHLSIRQFQQLRTLSNDFDDILVAEKGHDLPSYFTQTKFLKALRIDQRNLLSTVLLATRETLLAAMQDATQPAQIRVKAGQALGEIGDTRVGVSSIETPAGQLPDIDWVKIALNGTEQPSDTSQTLNPAYYSEYLISRYPITNAQYRCFIEDGGYEDLTIWNQLPKAARWWRNGKADNPKLINLIEDDADRLFYQQWLEDDTTRHEPRFWRDTKWNNDNHPVVGICWYEALAFTVWLSGKQQSVIPQGFINDNCEIRLPSEDEWEFAARGKEGHKHVWGEQKPNTQLANYAASGFEHTTPVGMYPASSSYGLFDMAGNTWDWTSSRWGKQFAQSDFSYEGWDDNAQSQERNLLDPIEFRTIRGASWLDSENYIRGDVRFRDHPLNRYDGIGFRIVYGLRNTPAEPNETPNTTDDKQVLSQFLTD